MGSTATWSPGGLKLELRGRGVPNGSLSQSEQITIRPSSALSVGIVVTLIGGVAGIGGVLHAHSVAADERYVSRNEFSAWMKGIDDKLLRIEAKLP